LRRTFRTNRLDEDLLGLLASAEPRKGGEGNEHEEAA
jgi:hypothetical protein